MRFEGTLEEPGVVNIRGVKARTRTVADEAGSAEFRFSADVPLELEDNRVRVSALGDNGQRAQKDYDVYILGQGGIGLPSYDSRGNMTGNGLNQGYEWDAASRLSAITYADGTQTEFGYDALGRRARVLERAGVAVQEKRLLWCGWEICQERDGGNAVVRRYGRHGFMDKDGVKRYYGRDHLGSVTQLLDEGGRVVERYSYDPYGVQPAEAEESPARSDMRYTGHYYHAKSGLHLAPYRAYDAKQGVWLSEDPIQEAGGINLYGYVGGSPVMAVDLKGLDRVIVDNGHTSTYVQTWDDNNKSTGWKRIHFGPDLCSKRNAAQAGGYLVLRKVLQKFAWTAASLMQGGVYIDDADGPPGGGWPISSSPQADRDLIGVAERMQRDPPDYNTLFFNCRHFTKSTSGIGMPGFEPPSFAMPILPSVNPNPSTPASTFHMIHLGY